MAKSKLGIDYNNSWCFLENVQSWKCPESTKQPLIVTQDARFCWDNTQQWSSHQWNSSCLKHERRLGYLWMTESLQKLCQNLKMEQRSPCSVWPEAVDEVIKVNMTPTDDGFSPDRATGTLTFGRSFKTSHTRLVRGWSWRNAGKKERCSFVTFLKPDWYGAAPNVTRNWNSTQKEKKKNYICRKNVSTLSS